MPALEVFPLVPSAGSDPLLSLYNLLFAQLLDFFARVAG